MSLKDYLEDGAEAVAVITALVIAVRWALTERARRQLRANIESAVIAKTGPNDDSLTEAQLAIHFGVSEDEVRRAAKGSKKIAHWGGPMGSERRYRAVRK